MEGVVVSAKKDGSTITISVITKRKGSVTNFPAARLEPGHYTLGARAAGYDLDGPKAADVKAADVGGRAGSHPPTSSSSPPRPTTCPRRSPMPNG